MLTPYNPSLRQEPRNQLTPIIPLTATEPLLVWLTRTGRLKPREIDLSLENEVLEDLEDILDPEFYHSEKEEKTSDYEE